MVVEKTKDNLRLLPVKVNLEVSGYEYYPETILPRGDFIKLLKSQHKTEGVREHVSYFCKESSESGAAGMAGGLGPCSTMGALNINACYGNCSIGWGDITGLSNVYSHEVGHNIGLKHSTDGGFMGKEPGSWSETSKQDQETWMRSSDSSCLSKN